MKDTLSMDDTVSAILSNFASINKQILFWPGNTLTTAHATGKLLARAKTDMVINRRFAIDDLPRLLNAISLFSDPKIMIDDQCLSIADSKHKMRYTFTDPENVKSKDPDSDIPMNNSYSFVMSSETLKDIQKAAGVLGMPEAAFVGNGRNAIIRVFNSSNPTSHLYSMSLGETTETFSLRMKVEWLCKILVNNYNITLDFERKIAHFHNPVIEYWVAMEFDDV